MKELGNLLLDLPVINAIIFGNEEICIAKRTLGQIERNYELVKNAASRDDAMYGINTGFGALAETRISTEHQAELQRNIILSHAVGVDEPLPFFAAKLLILLRLNTLIQGYSCASPALIHQLMQLLNKNCAPFVPKKGSVGASGDLAPLAHLGLLLLGIGDAFINNELTTAEKVLFHAGLKPLNLGVRDGLALINGTQAMSALAVAAIFEAKKLNTLADLSASCSLVALGGHLTPFDERLHRLKPHKGQIKTAENIRNFVITSHHHSNRRTQDPYSLRCVPQVHGASKDITEHVENTVVCEINSVTDNPLLFIDKKDNIEVVSGGNFHGQHLALALDYLAMGMAELANISERRMELLLNPNHSNGLPPFLIENSGLNSGYMMLHVTASALINENKVYCHPASVDSIPTSANREDHVSMGMTSANKLSLVLKNTKTVLAIELLMAMQGLDFRSASKNDLINELHRSFRSRVPNRKKDGLYKNDLNEILLWLEAREEPLKTILSI